MESSPLAGARYLDLPYRIILTKERRRGGNAWLALVEELPGCEARGDTPEEATVALREHMATWIASALERGQAIPRPRHDLDATNGQLSFAIPKSLHETIAHAAVREGLTVDQLVTVALAAVLQWRPRGEEPNGRWIQARAAGLAQGDNRTRQDLHRALTVNMVLLALVAVAAVVALIAAVAHGF